MASLWYPLAGCQASADERQTAYAGLSVRLYKSTLVPAPSDVLADYVAAEADYDGYAPQTMTAFFEPILAPVSGYLIQSPQVQFAYVDGATHVTNTVGGAFFVDGGGKLRMVLALQTAEWIGFAVNGDGWSFNIIDVFPTGFTA